MPKIKMDLLPHQVRSDIAFKYYKIVAMVSGTGAGKTWFGRQWSLRQAIEGKWRAEHYAISPFLGMSKKTLVIPMLHHLQDWGFRDGDHYEYNKSERLLYFKHNKNIIYIGGAKSHDSLQGVHAQSILCDEAGQYDNEAWLTIQQRRNFYNAPTLLTSTPYRFNFFKDLVDKFYSDMAAGIRGNIYSFAVPSIANPYYNREGFDLARETWPPWKFAMFYLGAFRRPMGIIYPNAYDHIIDPFVIPASWHTIAGLDFGATNPTGVIWASQDPETGIWYIWKEYKRSGMDENAINDVIGNINCKYYYDVSGKQTAIGLTNSGNYMVPGIKDVIPGIIKVNTMFNSGMLKVFSTCTETIKELNTYSYMIDKNDNVIEKPDKSNDHLMDALRYMLVTELGSPQVKVTHKGDRSRKKLINQFSRF